MKGDPPTKPIIEARGLSKNYGRFVAIQDVSFQIAPCQIVALLGLNGAGKTTIMRLLTGFIAPSDGHATIGGYDVERDRLDATSLIGYLPENGPLYGDMTPLEVLRFFGEARGLSASVIAKRIEAVSEQCDIGVILDKPMSKLSKGLRQRVGMAHCLLHDPAVIIMDEPTAGLDPVQIRHFRAHVRELRSDKTLLLSTHILQEVEAIADRVLIINDGRLVFDGTLTELSGGTSLETCFCELTGVPSPHAAGFRGLR
jgi:ABC-2 type transport system ATP-binding protein